MSERPQLENSWEEYRREARAIENDIDTKLLSLAKLSSRDARLVREGNSEKASLLSLSEDSFDRICSEIESLLKKLTELNNRMSDYCDKLQHPSAIYTVQRHREILNDYTNEFRKTRSDISSQLEREQLLSSVKKNDDYRNVNASSKITDLYLREQHYINNSERLVDEQISIAIKTRESLMNQRNAFKAIQTQMTTLANRFPIINSLVHRINVKKRKDTLILGAVIGICLFLLLLYVF